MAYTFLKPPNLVPVVVEEMPNVQAEGNINRDAAEDDRRNLDMIDILLFILRTAEGLARDEDDDGSKARGRAVDAASRIRTS